MGSKGGEEPTAWVIRFPVQGLSFLLLDQCLTVIAGSQLEGKYQLCQLTISVAAASTRGH